ncbi:hypothetical protein NDN08_005709 [Rhodosorus marinus]|uniref:Uncharacterized protein n=1 Tax=Rhodosorus marinus TaxID=101924 RepID=A0AAV8V349_9RHOD|nr:hypothetical protein NDN08_005709 [Rhodosorus marinus]
MKKVWRFWMVLVWLGLCLNAAGEDSVRCPRVRLSKPQRLVPVAQKRIGNIFFGHSVAMSGKFMGVGAYGLHAYAGAAYMFVREGKHPNATWVFQQVLKPNDRRPGDHYGLNIAMSLRTVIVGRPFADPSGEKSGSADVWVFNGRKWIRTQQLLPPGNGWGHRGAWFGYGVAAAGQFICVGARYQDKLDARGGVKQAQAGAVYVYHRAKNVGDPYKLVQILKGPNEVSFYGDELCLHGFEPGEGERRLLVGAPRHSPKGQGAAYLYVRKGNRWALSQVLSPSDLYPGNGKQHYGEGIAMSNTTIMIGGETAPSDKGRWTGQVYAYRKVGKKWVQTGPLNPPEGVTSRALHGQRLGTDGKFAAVGQWGNMVKGTHRAGSFSHYVRCSDDSWTTSKPLALKTPYEQDSFGKKVTVKDGFLVVSAPMRDTGPIPSAENRGAVWIYQYTTGNV